MLSHDNYTWTASSVRDGDLDRLKAEKTEIRAVSFLPLSHVVEMQSIIQKYVEKPDVAAQYADIFLSLAHGANVFFTDVNALRGTLINYLLEVRPVIFLGVPRVYEKMEEKVRSILESKPWIYKWAKHYGQLGTDAQMKGKEPPFMYKLIEKIVINKVKQNLGFDKVVKFFSGAAPLPVKTRQFFFELNMFINNTFGMSETSGPMTSLFRESYPFYDMKSAGRAMDGTEIAILKTDPKAEAGELCFRGRNIFMGYLKNEKATMESIDNQRRVHSGDEGLVNKDGCMFITGRIKELLVTAGGENVAPVPIENNIKEELPFLSNVMLIGDQMKFIAALLTFRVTTNAMEQPGNELQPEAIEYLARFGIKGVKTVDQVINNPEVHKVIQAGIDRANKKAVSNAAKVKGWFIAKDDFTIVNGEFTPTLKVKRSVVTKKYAEKITEIYSKQDL